MSTDKSPEELFASANTQLAYLIRSRIKALIDVYGSTRAVGRALGIDHAYLCRLMNGEKTNPRKNVLRKLGLPH